MNLLIILVFPFMTTSHSSNSLANGVRVGLIQDQDGYVNVRDKPSIKGGIVGVVCENEYFTYSESDSGNWWLINARNNLQGFVHKSRISSFRQGDVKYEHSKWWRFGEYLPKVATMRCADKELLIEWMSIGTSTPDKKTVFWNKNEDFLSQHQKNIIDLMRKYVKAPPREISNDYEVWGIIDGLNSMIRKEMALLSYDAWKRGERSLLASMELGWGMIALDTEGLDSLLHSIVSDGKIMSKIGKRFNEIVIFIAVMHKYELKWTMPEIEHLLQLYQSDYEEKFPDWYRPLEMRISLEDYFEKIANQRELSISDIPVVVIP